MVWCCFLCVVRYAGVFGCFFGHRKILKRKMGKVKKNQSTVTDRSMSRARV
jgi:hypothetical protein